MKEAIDRTIRASLNEQSYPYETYVKMLFAFYEYKGNRINRWGKMQVQEMFGWEDGVHD